VRLLIVWQAVINSRLGRWWVPR